MMKSTRFAAPLIALAVVSLATTAQAWDWEYHWKINGETYKDLDFTIRATVDRGIKTFESAVTRYRYGAKTIDTLPQFRASAAEWRKVQIQAEGGDFDEAILAYAVYMQACSYELAGDRNKAVGLYGEILELYPDVHWVTVPARYRLAATHLDMGDTRKGNEVLAAIVADSASEGHAVMADACWRYGGVLWDKGDHDGAVALWKRCMKECYRYNNGGVWNEARLALIVIDSLTGDVGDLEKRVYAMIAQNDAKGRYQRLEEAVNIQCNGRRHGHYGYYWRAEGLYPDKKKREQKIVESDKTFSVWLATQSAVCGAVGSPFNADMFAARVAFLSEGEAAAKKRCASLGAKIKAMPDVKGADGYVGWLISLAFDANLTGIVRTLPDYARNGSAKLRYQCDIERRFGNWKAVAMYLEEFLKQKNDPATEKALKWELADVYRERLGRYDEAEKIYVALNEPPRTLWALTDNYRRAGKSKECYRCLDELASIFAKDAPAAVLRKAVYKEQDGDKKTAVALYRRLLSQPEWKTTGESSQAHQALERLGYATGGAMTNEVR